MDVASILALAVLQEMLIHDDAQRWMNFLQQHGYLHVLASGLSSADGAVNEFLLAEDPSVRSCPIFLGPDTFQQFNFLYLHQARCSLFLRLGQSLHGVECLYDTKVDIRYFSS